MNAPPPPPPPPPPPYGDGQWTYVRVGTGPGCNGRLSNWNANGLTSCVIGDTWTFPANCYYVEGASEQQYALRCQ